MIIFRCGFGEDLGHENKTATSEPTGPPLPLRLCRKESYHDRPALASGLVAL